MRKFIILSRSDILNLFHNKPVEVYVDQDHIPHILCTDEYYDEQKGESLDMMDKQEESINNRLEDLSKRVENIEKQMKEDKEEQLKKAKADLDYAKFCCSLPMI